MNGSDTLIVGFILLAIAAVVLCPSVAARAVERLPGMDEFTVTYWWGPKIEETTPARYAEVKAAGFNLACPPVASIPGHYHPYYSVEENSRILDECAKQGLKAVVADARIAQALKEEAGWEALVEAVVTDYREHPALAGYYIADEPHAGMFGHLGAIQARIKALDPGHYGYINLFPNYAPPNVLQANDYRDYVERFVREVKPPFLCYDHYHLLDPAAIKGGEPFASEAERQLYDIAHAAGPREALFYENLTIVREVAQENGLPFMVIVLLVPHGPYRQPNEAELRWEAFQCLAHGASGVSYFSYWAPPFEDVWKFRDSALSFDGERTELYDLVRGVNRDLRAYGNMLLDRASEGAQFLQPNQQLSLAEDALQVSGGPATIGSFEGNHIFAANRDYYHSTTISVSLDDNARLMRVYPENRDETPVTDDRLVLDPGDAVLLRVYTDSAEPAD